MPGPGNIKISDYHYELPRERIAKYPLDKRDASKLLFLDREGNIQQQEFSELPDLLPQGSLMVLNNTKVVKARIFFRKASGAKIEVFCLEPSGDYSDVHQAFAGKSGVLWKCLVGNAKKWKNEALTLHIQSGDDRIFLKAQKIEREEEAFIIRFEWEPPHLTFAEVLQAAGQVPLPPYLNREAEAKDNNTYQTVYAKHDGSVAAPTAGLHFTDTIFSELQRYNIDIEYLTLHVSAGTFRPVSTETIDGHHMHEEEIVITIEFLEKLLKHGNGFITAVGTTSVRTLESIYILGQKVLKGEEISPYFHISQWEAYHKYPSSILDPRSSIIEALLDYMRKHQLKVLYGDTRMIIVPGYNFSFVDALVTNFHMPGSTLLLLVAALVGDQWKDAYEYALKNDFRFLSYGDSCLFYQQLSNPAAQNQ